MNYVISDVHGCYDLFLRMLDKIGFSDSDTLYFLGDAIDRGLDGIPLVLDLMQRQNVIPFLGNHEDMMLKVAGKLGTKMTPVEMASVKRTFANWTQNNGGDITWAAFCELPEEKRNAIVAWLKQLKLYEEVAVNGNRFLLVHAGVGAYEENKDPLDCTVHDFIWERMDYDRIYYPDRYLVTGHTPTGHIDPTSNRRILRKNNHVAIDCGTFYTGTLGCFCLDTMEEFYVSEEN